MTSSTGFPNDSPKLFRVGETASDFVGDKRMLIRLYAEVQDEAAAVVVAEAVQAKLAELGRVEETRTQQYWKMPEYHEVFCVLRPRADVAAVFQRVLDSLASGWEVHRFADGGDWAVWNPREGTVFVLPQVRWGNVECDPWASA